MLTALEASSREGPDIYEYLCGSHADLDRQLDRLIAAIEANDPELRRRWNRVEAELLAHMDAEERFVLPSFAHVDLAESTGLLREHGRLRERMLELGVAIDLHYVRIPMCMELVELLRAHAYREQKILYRWVATSLHPELLRATVHRIEDSAIAW